jgi:hypothetical protein
MNSTATASFEETYSFADIEGVVRRVLADLKMAANSTGAQTEQWAINMAHDIEVLAKHDYLKSADVTLLSGWQEIAAVCYKVNTKSGGLTSTRPGGMLWPQVLNPRLRVILSLHNSYTAAAELALQHELRFSWTTTSEDTSHAGLNSGAGRTYASNAFGMQRTDFTR